MGENKSSRAQQLTGGGLLCIHYDFLPQSADMEEPGELKLRDNGTATVELKSMVRICGRWFLCTYPFNHCIK